MSLRERALGRLATLMPNRKFAATGLLAVEAELVPPGEARAMVRANAAFVWSYYLRFARLASGRGRGRAYDRITSCGEEHLRTAVAQGRGVILLSVHLGDFDLGGGWLAERQAITPVVVTRPLRPNWRNALFSFVRRRCGVVLRDADHTGLEDLERDLGLGRALLVMLDRRPAGPASPSRIFGKPAAAPLAIALLAARSGAPLLPAATWRDGDGQTIAWFGEPVTAADPAVAAARMGEVAERLGDLIRAHPEQWHVPADAREMAWAPPEARRRGVAYLPDLASSDRSFTVQMPSAKPAVVTARPMTRTTAWAKGE